MNRLVALAFSLLVLAVYADPLLTDRTFGGRDLPAYNLPMEKAVHEAYRRGRLPVWEANVSGGRPLLPNPNAGALYPARVLLAAVPFAAAVKIYPVFHWILAGTGMVLLLAGVGASGAAQWLGAATYVFSGVAVSEVFFPHIQPGMALLPWILWAIDRRTRRSRRILWLSILLALDMLAGDVFTVAMGFLAGLLWIVLEEPRYDRRALTADLFAAAAIGLLAAAPQIVATALWIPQTARAVSGITVGESFFFSLSPWRILEFVIPFPFGATARLDESAVWGRVLFHDKSVGLFSTLYAGALPLLALAAKPSLLSERGCSFARALFITALGVCVLPSLLSEGFRTVRSPLALRNPEKFAVLCVLALAILAGRAYDAHRRKAFSLRWPLAVGAGFAATAAVASSWPGRAGAAAVRLIGAPASAGPVAAALLAPALAEAGLLWIATVVALAALRAKRRVAEAASIALLTLVPVAADRRIAQTFPETEVLSRTSFARKLERLDPEGRYRTLGESIYRRASPLQIACQGMDPSYTDYARRSWTQHTQALWGRGTIFNYDFDAGDLSRTDSLRRVARRLAEYGDPSRLFAGLGLRFGVRFRDQPPLPGFRRFGGDLLQDWDVNPEALPAPRLVQAWRGETGALAALEDLPGLAARQVVLETGIRSSGAARLGRVSLSEDSPERFRLETESLDPSWLFVARSFWTYRTVEVDGRSVEAVPAQLAFTAVPVPAGRHDVLWRERVPGGEASRWGPLLFAIAVVGLIAAGPGRLLKNGYGRRVRHFAAGARSGSSRIASAYWSRGRRQSAVHPSGYGGAGPSAASSLLDDAGASPSSRFLASGPAALVTPSHTLFQQPARRGIEP